MSHAMSLKYRAIGMNEAGMRVSRFQLRPTDGRVRVWRERRHRFQPHCLSTMHGGGSVHVWGAICRDGRSDLVILRDFVTGESDKKILDDHLLPWATQQLGQLERDWKF